MYERNVSIGDIESALMDGNVIENYPDDQPYLSRLILGFVGDRPLHMVVASNDAESCDVLVTVYEPVLEKWEEGFSRRKK